jgi:hypothetical protein
MAYVIYPECTNDTIRKKEIDLMSPFSKKDIYPQTGNVVCMICAPEKRAIAKGNRFDGVDTVEDTKPWVDIYTHGIIGRDTEIGNGTNVIIAAKVNSMTNMDLVAIEPKPISDKYSGKDNYGRLKSVFIEELKTTTEEMLFERCEHLIWLSSYAANNPRSDYHWQCDACYDECQRRKKPEIYKKAYKEVSESI